MRSKYSREKFHGGVSLSSQKVNIGLVSLSFITVVILCLLGLMYVVQANDIANKGYNINKIEKEIQTLKDDNEELRTEIAKNQSIHNLQSFREDLNLSNISPSDVQHIEVVEDVLVVKD